METTNNLYPTSANGQVKKQWQQPLIIEISKINVEKNAFAQNESTWVPGFTPFTQYHS